MMKPILMVFAVYAIVFEAVAESANQATNIRNKRSYDRWLEIIAELAKRSGGSGGNSLSAFPIQFPIADKDGRQSLLPLLVLPFPVPVPDYNSKGECNAQEDKTGFNNNRFGEDHIDVRFGNSRFGNSKFAQDVNSIAQDAPTEVSSDYLIKVFRRQHPIAPELPPAVIGYPPEIIPPNIQEVSIQGESQRFLPLPQDSRQYLPPQPQVAAARKAEPSLPTFDRSMVLHGFLTVFRADYTEPYSAWYDARTGASRVEYHEGGTTCYRMMMSNNRVKRSTMYTDRTGEQDSIVCGVTAPGRASAEDRQPPALPDTEGFEFAGYKEEFGGQAEVWKREIRGGPGELGAARGESLVYHHELLVHRRQDDFVVPLKYTVLVDSSVLGPQCDGYEHIYSQYREKEHNEDEFRFSERQCDVKETLDVSKKEHMARLEPIREYTLMARAPVHDEAFESFTKEFSRTYIDAKEEAMRKNLLCQRNRFITSCNRQSATFSVGINFLSDRLDEEIQEILGVSFSAEFENNTLSFPLVEGRSGISGKDLPKEWDWRTKGAVSSVKFQGVSCSSCWAFAVTGSVEGALFIKTKQLVELSVQALVDCSKSHGAHGCNKIGTWPVHAYNYIKDRGLPAVGEYADYDAKDHKCKAPPSEPTTHIEGGVDVPPNNIEALKMAIRRYAPSVVVVDAQAKSFISYKKGVLRDDRCVKGPKKKLNHAVLSIGWGEQKGEPHFIIKNSWSAAWGEEGYIRLHAPSNTCGVLTVPSFARLQRRNIDKLPAGKAASASDDDDDNDDDDRR